MRKDGSYRWKLIEYWFRRENKGRDEHFRLVGLITTSLKLMEELRAAMRGKSYPEGGEAGRPSV